MFLRANVQGVDVHLLVVTGATLTLVSNEIASSDIRETLSKDKFVDALVDSEIRICVKQSLPTNLNEAIQIAVELEAYNRAERKSHLRATITEPS